MADADIIVVDDTSPTILYSPFSDTFGAPDFTAGWNPLFNRTSLGGQPLNVGNSTTVHVTSRDGASFLINFQGTDIQLLGSAFQASYRVLVDGIPQSASQNPFNHTLATVRGLKDTNHTLILTTEILPSGANQTQSFVVFDQAIITSPIPSASNSSNFTSQPLLDNAISFLGQWDFFNQSNPPVHQSNAINDTTRASFKGRSLQIRGTVSPTGGDYTVKLDNITTQFSARASFTQENTLLFYSGGLDPDKVHTYELTNGGGTLTLPVNGSMVFASGDPNSPATPTSSSTPIPAQALSGSPLSPGTIAALVLAGILGFLLITGFLFYFFVYRPRKKHKKFLRRTARPMPRPSDLVLDIGPQYNTRHEREYLRWKRDVEGGNGSKDLGILFRHTPSPEAKKLSVESVADIEEYSARSFRFTPSPKNGETKGSKASSLKSWFSGKKKKKGSPPSSPSFTIDLPPLQTQNLSVQPSSDSRQDLSQTSNLQPRSSFTGATSLSYLSTSSDPSRQFSFNRPEDSSHNLHTQTDSHGLLLIDDSIGQRNESRDNVSVYPATVSTQPPQVFVEEVTSSYEESVHSRPSQFHLSRNPSVRSGDDRGSVRTYDDGLSVLGASTTRAAMRGLGPRTSVSVSSFATFGINSRRPDEGFAGQLGTLEESPPNRPTTAGVPPVQSLSEDQESYRVDVRTGSPFRIDLKQTMQEHLQPEAGPSTAAITRSNRLSVRFDETQVPSGATGTRESTFGGIKPLPQPPQSSFRLTPLAPLPAIISPASGSSEVDSPSFLDFDIGTGSSGASQVTSSNEQTGSLRSRLSRPQSSSFSSRPMGARSRWSTTTPSSHNQQDSSVSSPSSPSSSFPFPVSLPASPHHPEGHKPSQPPSSALESAPQYRTSGQTGLTVPASETNVISPVESVPMSISDLHFRQSDSDDVSEHATRRRGSLLPPHPPLPSLPPTPTFPATTTSGPEAGSSSRPIRSSLPLTTIAPTEPPLAVTRHARTHSRTASADLMTRRPLGPRMRESQH